MIYLSQFEFPHEEAETSFIMGVRRTCYSSYYPFKVLSRHSLYRLEFEPVTILYGGNGSGKTSALNVIGEKLSLRRETLYNRSCFFDDYTRMCRYETRAGIPADSSIITSDDVFDYMLNLRALNEGIDVKREELFQDYLDAKFSDFKYRSLEDYDRLKKVNLARSKTQSRYVKQQLMEELREQSNGESAFFYFTGRIRDDALYLLDEPENSLAPARQLELAEYIENQARFFGCQFVIATHSPFLLAMRGARVYDLDSMPVCVRKWTQLEAVREYYSFFRAHSGEFDSQDE